MWDLVILLCRGRLDSWESTSDVLRSHEMMVLCFFDLVWSLLVQGNLVLISPCRVLLYLHPELSRLEVPVICQVWIAHHDLSFLGFDKSLHIFDFLGNILHVS